MRNGRIAGIKGNRKYRLKTLGFSDERLKELSNKKQIDKRLKEIKRNTIDKEKNRER